MNSISVKQLNLYVKSLLDGDSRLTDIAVTGEISNFKNHYASGHWYFTLKDSEAAVRCVMFRGNNIRTKFKPEDGMQVTIRGRAAVYEKDGQFQLYCDEMIPSGIGDILLAVEQIKKQLSSEGLFDKSRKRKIPEFPEKIAVITSETGAAVRDIINIVTRRFPICQIILCPVSVQGDSAVGEMSDALDRVFRLKDIDTVIIGRGGGSAEDLWAFNSEIIAHKIAASPFPVISAVGHETDYTVADFVADLRAPTPSAAAELAVPDISEIRAQLNGVKFHMTSTVKKRLEFEKSRLLKIMSSRIITNPQLIAANAAQRLDRNIEKLNSAEKNTVEIYEKRFAADVSRLDSINPIKVMSRGFSIAEAGNEVIRSIKQISKDSIIKVHLCDGYADCVVEEIHYGK